MVKKILFLLCLLVVASFSATSKKLNTNSWSISINKKQVLHSSSHKYGETIFIPEPISDTDTLLVDYYYCGQGGQTKTTHIVLKTLNNTIAKHIREESSGFSYSCSLPLKDMEAVKQNHQDNLFALYFYSTDSDTPEPENLTIPLAHLQIGMPINNKN